MSKTRNQLCFGWKFRLLVRFLDWIHWITKTVRPKKKREQVIQRILLCNWASLGDVLLATSVIAPLRKRFPGVKIGFLVSKNSKTVLDTCEGIDWIHEVENFPLTLSGPGFRRKLFAWARFSLRDNRAIAREIAKKNYTCAIDLYPFFPNCISILWHAKIPLRIGFDTGGNSYLLNIISSWNSENYLTVQYAKLLNLFGIEENICPQILLSKQIAPNGSYFVFHPCSSGNYKELPVHFWKELYSKCKKAGISIFFTGHGRREEAFIQEIGAGEKESLCGKLSWKALISTLQQSRGVISVDSVPVHLAAALNRPYAVLYQKYTNLWYPKTEKGTAFGKNGAILVDAVFNWIKERR